MFLFEIVYFVTVLIVSVANVIESEFCDISNKNTEMCLVQSHFTRKRYILYDVKPPEGFNLRRDVYVRVAVFMKKLNEKDKDFQWQLVLPPWGNLYHWRNTNVIQKQLPWNKFFDIRSLQRYIPVIEMYEFLEEYSFGKKEVQIDCVYVLQDDEEMFKTGKFENKNEVVDCNYERLRYHKLGQTYTGPFWDYRNITVKDVKCLKFHGVAFGLYQNLKPVQYKSVMFDNTEIALHDEYGSNEYWTARRSMRYNSKLYNIAKNYRETVLNSTDERDNTKRPLDWTKEKNRRNAKGGPYLAVHLRRRDFIIGHKDTVPTISNAASQLQRKMEELELNVMFVATDAEQHEYEELKLYLSNFKVTRFVPLDKLEDGSTAIIDQIICSYARYFIGTHESTFTFRIQEDREIIGFPPETTFNRLCKTNKKCKLSGSWQIVW